MYINKMNKNYRIITNMFFWEDNLLKSVNDFLTLFFPREEFQKGLSADCPLRYEFGLIIEKFSYVGCAMKKRF